MPFQIEVPDLNKLRQSAGASAQKETQMFQTNLLEAGKILSENKRAEDAQVQEQQQTKEKQEQWAIEHLMSVYQNADPELQENLSTLILSNPTTKAMFEKYGVDPIAVFSKTKQTTKEKATNQLDAEHALVKDPRMSEVVSAKARMAAEAETQPEVQEADRLRAKNTLLAQSDPEVVAQNILAAEEEAKAKAELEENLADSRANTARLQQVLVDEESGEQYTYKEARDQGIPMIRLKPVDKAYQPKRTVTPKIVRTPQSVRLAWNEYDYAFRQFEGALQTDEARVLTEAANNGDIGASKAYRKLEADAALPALRTYAKATATSSDEDLERFNNLMDMINEYINIPEKRRNPNKGVRLYETLKKQYYEGKPSNPLFLIIKNLTPDISGDKASFEVTQARNMYHGLSSMQSEILSSMQEGLYTDDEEEKPE